MYYIGPVVLHAYPRVCNREAVRALNLAAPKHSDRQVNDQARNANWGAGYDRNKGWSDKNWERKQVCCFMVLGLGCLWAWFGPCHLQESKWQSKGSAVSGWDPKWATVKGGRATKSPEKPKEYDTPLPFLIFSVILLPHTVCLAGGSSK